MVIKEDSAKTEVAQRKERNGSIEFLRVICMLGIICLHVIGYGPYAPFSGGGNATLRHLRWFLNVGVDVFAFISGFYGIRFSVKKLMNLFYIGVFSSAVVFICEIRFFDVPFSVKSPVEIFFKQWYFREYLVLFLIAPFVNYAFDSLDSDRLKYLSVPVVLLYLWNFIATQLPSSFGQSPVLGNHSAVLLLIIYMFGRFMGKTEFLSRLNVWILIAVIVLCFPILWNIQRLKDFSSPFCIASAVCIFELFRRMKLPAVVGKVSAFLSPSMLGILILHNAGSRGTAGGLLAKYFATNESSINLYRGGGIDLCVYSVRLVPCG